MDILRFTLPWEGGRGRLSQSSLARYNSIITVVLLRAWAWSAVVVVVVLGEGRKGGRELVEAEDDLRGCQKTLRQIWKRRGDGPH